MRGGKVEGPLRKEWVLRALSERVDFGVEVEVDSEVVRGTRWTVEQKSIESATSYPPISNEPDRPEHVP